MKEPLLSDHHKPPARPGSNRASHFNHFQNACKIFSLLTIIAFLSLNIYYFTPPYSRDNFSKTVAAVLQSTGQLSNSNQTAEIGATPSKKESVPTTPSDIDEFWQFEPTVRLHDNHTDIPTKYVLLWTLFFGPWGDHFNRNHGQMAELEIYNSEKRCLFTRNRTFLDKASALLFHGRDFDFGDLPKQRFPFQRYIFYLHESPVHSGFGDGQWQQVNNMQFNWTMTYAKLGNVYFPYGHVRRLKGQPDLEAINTKIRGFAKSFKSRPGDAVWVVSNCYAPSMRRSFADKLVELGIKVDIYGACGNKGRPDDEWKSKGETQFFSRYRFVFAFENSLCQDYVTEKAFHAFYATYAGGAIPVLYGAGNYSDLFPNGSYIDMRSFKRISDLANLMKKLSQSDENSPLLLHYYDWLRDVNPSYNHDYELEKDFDMYAQDYAKRPGWRNLCRKLWDLDTGNNEDKKTFNSTLVPDIRKQLGSCISADLSPLGQRRKRKTDDHEIDRYSASKSFSWRGVYPNGTARLIQLISRP